MRRLLQGDVGCGKTAVALLASLAVIEHGRQVALMAPTEVLAGQHEQRFRALLAGTRCRVGLLAASVRGAERSERIRRIARGEIDLVLGTHALLEAQVRFADLGLVIVDEQHRFGVRQRTRLAEKGMEPHFLLMTATPIPQSLALVLCGDLDVSVIDELPPGRAPVRTVLRSEEDRPRILAFLRSEVERGRRAIVVCSRVEDEEGRDARAAVSEARRLAAGPFAGLEVGLLHGRLAPEAKRAALEGFASGRTPVLVTTTVFEVGVDVPEATVILVERADRYGLAQLHQIRGRVGRGPIPSWCILVPGSDPTPEGAQRLRALTEISDGFEIATRDLQLRGPGEFRGLRQSGAPDLRVADPGRDLDLLLAAREEAERIVPPRIGSAGSQSRFLPQIR
jgi:ATP-dependent DNA helicase RecG